MARLGRRDRLALSYGGHRDVSSVLDLPGPSPADLDDAQDQGQEQDDDADRRGIAQLGDGAGHGAESDGVEVGAQRLAGMVGAAVRQHVNLVEDLDAADGIQDYHDGRDRREQRHGHADEALPGIRTIQGRRFVQLLRYVLQPGEEDDHVETHRLPDGDGDDAGHHRHVVGQPEARQPVQAKAVQRRVKHAEVGLIDHRPEQAGDGQGDDNRHEVDGTKDHATTDAAIEQRRDEQRDDGLQHHGDDDEIGGMLQGLQKDRVL